MSFPSGPACALRWTSSIALLFIVACSPESSSISLESDEVSGPTHGEEKAREAVVNASETPERSLLPEMGENPRFVINPNWVGDSFYSAGGKLSLKILDTSTGKWIFLSESPNREGIRIASYSQEGSELIFTLEKDLEFADFRLQRAAISRQPPPHDLVDDFSTGSSAAVFDSPLDAASQVPSQNEFPLLLESPLDGFPTTGEPPVLSDADEPLPGEFPKGQSRVQVFLNPTDE
jgi:hypothetical protein